MIRILLVDDQNLVQQGIKLLLDQDSEFKVIGTVRDGRSAVKQTNALCPDIVLLDIEMPGMDGITATKYITRLSPKTKVIILSSHEDKKYLTQALMAGAKSYILKSSLMTELKQSIIAVNNGYTQIESRLLAKIFDPSNIKLRSSKSPVKSEKANLAGKSSQSAIAQPTEQTKPHQDSPEIEAIGVSASESIPSQGRVDRAQESDLVVWNQSDSTPIVERANSESTDRVDVSDLKPLKIVPRLNLPESVPPVKNNVRFNSITLSKSDRTVKSSNSINRFLPVAIKPSATKISRIPQNKLWQKLSVLAFAGKSNIWQIMNRPQLSKYSLVISQWYRLAVVRCKPAIALCRTRSVYYWHKLSLLVKHWHEKGWLANAGLIFLGLITVLIIHLMFS